MPAISYQRLTWSSARGGFAVVFRSRSSLWLGPDHLLCVETNGYTETYKRFYFRDIQAISLRETGRRYVWNAILVLPLVGCVVGWVMNLVSANSLAAIIVWGIFVTLLVVPFAINNLLGATCASQLRTAVQVENLPSLCRVRQTRKVLAKIRPLIAAAQGGELTPEAVAAQMRDRVLASAEASPAKIVPDDPSLPPRLVP
ncbi:MAG TPA: hypothetical protein VFY06_04830 [Verrucomicrobiae bacterium]|nr:hypothetical protein [Verrucomicrobiae bacterium]